MRACFMLARVCTPSSSVREIERRREIWRERGREREGERDGGKEGERERERERERCRICPKLLFLFLKGMTGALATFSYLVER